MLRLARFASPLGKAIAPVTRKLNTNELNDFIHKSFKADMPQVLSRPRSYIYGNTSSFQPTAKAKIINFIKKRSKTGKTFYSRQQVADTYAAQQMKPARAWLKKLGENYKGKF